MNKYDSKDDTMKHIAMVGYVIDLVNTELKNRIDRHDSTKLESPEKEIFDEYTPKLKESTFGSDEYKSFLKEMKTALDHHYFHNDHHPEYFLMGCEYNNVGVFYSPLERMNLIQIIEMMCDWYAATKRHDDGDIFKSIEINQERFGYGDELKMILEHTAQWLVKNDR
jgi:hypothetical protein